MGLLYPPLSSCSNSASIDAQNKLKIHLFQKRTFLLTLDINIDRSLTCPILYPMLTRIMIRAQAFEQEERRHDRGYPFGG